jgi:hypothetical protein
LLRSTLERFPEGLETIDLRVARRMLAVLESRPAIDDIERLAAE